MLPHDILHSFLEGKTSITPTFIITYGPPASGKSAALKSVCQDLGIDYDNVVQVLVDEVIEKMPGYNEESVFAYDNFQQDPVRLQKELTSIYFKYRHSWGDILSTHLLNDSIVNRHNIAWETTGNSADWIIKTIHQVRSHGYKVVLVFPFVPPDDLVLRANARVSRSHPRRPDEARIRQNFITAQQNLRYVAPLVDAIYVYDNSGPPGSAKIVVSHVKEMRGYCNKGEQDSECRRGISKKTRCDDISLTKLAPHFSPEMQSSLQDICGKKYGGRVRRRYRPYI
jgi:predicted ABC-type ATPase